MILVSNTHRTHTHTRDRAARPHPNQILRLRSKFLVYMNDLLNSGNIADLYAPDEKDGVTGQVFSKAKAAGLTNLEPDSLYAFFISQVPATALPPALHTSSLRFQHVLNFSPPHTRTPQPPASPGIPTAYPSLVGVGARRTERRVSSVRRWSLQLSAPAWRAGSAALVSSWQPCTQAGLRGLRSTHSGRFAWCLLKCRSGRHLL